MSLTDMVIMRGADYQAACDAIRAKTGKTDLIKAGDMAKEIESIPINKLNDFLLGNIAEITEEDTKGLTTTNQYKFAYIEGIEKAVFKDLTAIPAYCFASTKTVENGILDFHAITSIAARAFQSGFFSHLIIRTPTVCTLSNTSAFASLTGIGHYLYVPSALVESYKSATNWSSVIGDSITNIYAIEDYPNICGG